MSTAVPLSFDHPLRYESTSQPRHANPEIVQFQQGIREFRRELRQAVLSEVARRESLGLSLSLASPQAHICPIELPESMNGEVESPPNPSSET